MKKIMVLSFVLAIPLLLAGCALTDNLAEKATEKVAEKAIETVTNAEVDLGEGEISITGEDGESMSLGEDLEVPEDFPADVPVYGDATISSVSSVNESFYLGLTTDDDYDDIKDFYEKQLEKKGWTIDNTSSFAAQGQSTTYLCTQDTRNLSVGLFEDDDVTTITIAVTPIE